MTISRMNMDSALAQIRFEQGLLTGAVVTSLTIAIFFLVLRMIAPSVLS